MSGLIFCLWFGNVVFDTIGQLAFKAAAAGDSPPPARSADNSLKMTRSADSGAKAGRSAAKGRKSAAAANSVAAYWLRLLQKPALWLGIFAYVAEFLLWLAFLTMVPLSEGVLLGSVNIIVIMILGRFFFGERLTPLRVAGIGLVALGVAAVGAF